MSTPVRTPRHLRSRSSDSCKFSENLQPNIPISTPSKKSTPCKKSASRSASKPRNPSLFSPPPPPLPRERKFVIAKKSNSTKQVNDLEAKKRQEAAYEKLRSSQEEFFKKDMVPVLKAEASKNEREREELKENESLERKTKSMVMEEAMNSIPEPGSGRVKHLVKAFESLLSISEKEESGKERKNILMDWLMPNMATKAEESNGCECLSSPGFSAAEMFSVRGHEREQRLCSSLDGLDGRLSLSSRTSGGGRRNRRHSLDSSRKSWNKKLKSTNQRPFKLRTEQRGRLKEQIFVKKVTEMLLEEEKRRIPIAQGIPWTIDEPEFLIKPPVKESTEPLDIVLHSDVRAVERAEFDQYVTERLEMAKQFKLERERRQKMEEEEEIRRLRKILVPRAQPMPYFDRPFIPKRSAKPRTVPKEPKFHVKPAEESSVCLLGRTISEHSMIKENEAM